jgi:hypothetical protein
MTISNELYFSLVEESLQQGKPVRIVLKGTSMQPTLIGGDVLTLVPLEADPAVGDVVLFHFQGRTLLHRVVAVDGGRYTLRGDNCASCEHASRQDIVGLLAKVEKKHLLKHLAVRWLGAKGRRQLRPWYFGCLAVLMWAPLNGVGIPLDNYLLGLRMDHLLHASVFIPCSLFWMDLFRGRRRSWCTWLAAVATGLLTEGVQYLLPYRGFDVNDLIANFLGASLGWLLILLARRLRLNR